MKPKNGAANRSTSGSRNRAAKSILDSPSFFLTEIISDVIHGSPTILRKIQEEKTKLSGSKDRLAKLEVS